MVHGIENFNPETSLFCEMNNTYHFLSSDTSEAQFEELSVLAHVLTFCVRSSHLPIGPVLLSLTPLTGSIGEAQPGALSAPS